MTRDEHDCEKIPFPMSGRPLLALVFCLAALGVGATLDAQRAGSFMGSADDPAIKYSTAPLRNPVVEVNRRLQDGAVKLTFEGRGGYLRSALEALQLQADSQLLVFSRDSLQGKLINERNPRAIYFNDQVALGWVRDGEFIEVTAQDESAGVVFYTLEQRPDPLRPPQFMRTFRCLQCHASGDTLGVPGLLMFSMTTPDSAAGPGVPQRIDHSDPLARRFGGWIVTGRAGGAAHLGNDIPALSARPSREIASTDGLFDPDGYRTASSDIVAHLVFAHQAGMTNLLTRAGWEARAADPKLHPPFLSTPEDDARVRSMMAGVAAEVVDYLLFVDEARPAARVQGASGFAERFSSLGPRDRKGRSLRELDLNRRLMKYPCSYLIYSPAFDALPPNAKEAIYARLWEILSGQERAERYQAALSHADRQAIVEILRETKNDLPEYFRDAIR
jgi:hypothetical protein